MKSLRSKWHRAVVTVLIASRHEAKLTQKELADRIGWHISKIAKIESYERRVDVPEFIQIAHGLQIDPVELMTRALNW